MVSYNPGDVVVILRSKYREVPIGAVGTVRRHYNDDVSVVFADIHNKRSSYDCFYFKVSEVKFNKNGIMEGDKIMEGNYTIAHVQFLEGANTDKVYHYALYDPSVAIGDVCVVKSAHHGLGIARVVDIMPKTDEKMTREIVCRVDFTAYEGREAIRKRRAELKRKMAERAAALQEIALYKMMAAEDASMADLMREFDVLEEC